MAKKRHKVIFGGLFYIWSDRLPEEGAVYNVPGGSRAAANGAVKVQVTSIEDVQRSGRDTVYRVGFRPKVY